MSVDVVLSHHWRDENGKDHLPGDRVSVDDDTARSLFQSMGRPATQSAAKEAGVDPDLAASVKK